MTESAWAAMSVAERRQAAWERRGLVEEGGALMVACMSCSAFDEVYALDVDQAVAELLAHGWAFEELGGRAWRWSCPGHPEPEPRVE